MSDQHENQPVGLAPEEQSSEDVTGRDRLVSNIVISWAAHFVFIVAGFIMPRMIDQRLGRGLLGVWDFSWSLVSYFNLVQAGIGSSVSRYVAKYRAAGDLSRVNRVVSSAVCVLVISGLLVLGLTIATWLLLPSVFGARLGEHIDEARLVVLFLGASIASQVIFSAFTGVLTGCHRWGLHNGIRSGFHIVAVAGMIVALLQGGGLRSLAAIAFLEQTLADAMRVILSYRICRGLRISATAVRWKTTANLFAFGGKTVVPLMSRFLLYQATSILIVGYLGPAALALFVRPRSLMHHVYVLVQRMALTLTPTVSSLHGTGDLAGIRNLTVKSVRYSFYLALPMVVVLAVFGGAILRFWMGPDYANNLLPAVLAIGYLAPVVNLPLLSILAGMNAHGRAGTGQLVASLCSVGLTVLVLGPLKLGLVGTAFAFTLPLTIVNAIYLPVLTCRRIDLSLRQYFLSVCVGPAAHVLPFAICLVAARLFVPGEPLLGLLAGGAIGGAALAVLYWRYVLPDQIREKVLVGVSVRGRAA